MGGGRGGPRADEGTGVNVAFTNHHSREPDIGNLATHPRVLRKEDPSGSPPSLTPSPSPAIPPDPILPSCLVARRFAPFLVAIPASIAFLRRRPLLCGGRVARRWRRA